LSQISHVRELGVVDPLLAIVERRAGAAAAIVFRSYTRPFVRSSPALAC
jgi:hypothetical protein